MVKRKKRRRYKIKNIILLLFVLFIIIITINFIFIKEDKVPDNKNNIVENTQTTYLNKIIKDANFNDEVDKKLESKIIEYMDTYFSSMTTLDEIDMTNFFSDDAYEEAYIHQTAISMLVNIRKLQRNTMTISDAKYDIIYKKISIDEDKISVTFLENDYLYFDFMKDIESKAFGIENTIVFKLVDNSYKILSVRKVQDFYVMITNKYETGKTKKEAKEELDAIKDDYISDYKDEINSWKDNESAYKSGGDEPLEKCDKKYNRGNALSYAKKYAINRNPNWMDYSDIGGNCQNYASQVIYAGGIPMDTAGNSSLQWKHYSSELDSSNNKTGRTSSWTTVPYFYDYAKNNTGYGLCSITDINPFYAEAGDIGQVGYDGNFRHTVVIIGNIKDKDGNILDLLINSNSVNLENYPLSGYVYPNKRIIKILGWNEK